MDFIIALAQIVKGLPGQKGMGIFWWGAEYQTLDGYYLGGFASRSLFGFDGNVLPAADALGQLSAPTVLNAAQMNGSLQLRWPLSGAGMALQTATNLSPASWLNIADLVQSTNGVFSISLPMDAGAQFYRLKSN